MESVVGWGWEAMVGRNEDLEAMTLRVMGGWEGGDEKMSHGTGRENDDDSLTLISCDVDREKIRGAAKVQDEGLVWSVNQVWELAAVRDTHSEAVTILLFFLFLWGGALLEIEAAVEAKFLPEKVIGLFATQTDEDTPPIEQVGD